MNDESLNVSLRKFLKFVGVSSQREIERAIAAAIADGRLKGNETLQVKMTLEIPAAGVRVPFDGKLELE